VHPPGKGCPKLGEGGVNVLLLKFKKGSGAGQGFRFVKREGWVPTVQGKSAHVSGNRGVARGRCIVKKAKGN